MICSKCGTNNSQESQFCTNCGNQLNNSNITQSINVNNTTTNNNNQTNNLKTPNKSKFNKKQKIILGSFGVLIIVLLIFAISIAGGSGTRTVMIYIVGSNLETDGEIVTADLNAINPSSIDLSKTNILLYTGGTEKWHNFVSNQDNGIYILQSDGFKKLESQEQYNLGDPSTLSNFIKYAYDNYKADKYDLIFYNHGGAIDGAIYDDISNDNLSLQDMTKALEDSPFNEKNKLDAVLFRTCLNGTIELANIFSPYANYLIGSEEVSWGSKYSSVLGFLNEVTKDDNGHNFGVKFVKSYEKQMSEIDPYNSVKHTYSVIDLSKINKVNKELDNYIKELDLSKNYADIVKIRTNAYQYGQDAPNYDMIDLYDFVSKTSKFSTNNGQNLLKALEDAIVYNSTNENNSHGLSIYFPYKGGKGQKYKFIEEVYSHLNYSNNYKEFIKSFNNTRSSNKAFSFNVTDSSVVDTKKENVLEIQLTEEQKNNYAYSTVTIFQQDSEHKNYYKPIFNSDNTTLEENGILKINYENQLTKVKDDKTGEYDYALTYYRKQDNLRTTYGVLYDTDAKIGDSSFMSRANLYLADNNGKLIISTAKLMSNNERLDGILLNLDEYEKYEVWTYSYRILDNSGNVMDTSKWESAPVITGFSGNLKEFELEYASLDKGDNYYALFIITDMNGNTSYSKLLKVGE